MFKSIEYKLYLFTLLLMASVGSAVWLFIKQEYVYGTFSIFIMLFSLSRLYHHYIKFNKNILFLLNAIDNGDYSFNFAETKLSRRERELNKMMNRIKEILSKAKHEVIENEKFLSLIVQSVPTGIIILDDKNNIIVTNRAAILFLGLPVLTHLNQLKVVDNSFPDLFRGLKAGSENKQIRVINEKEEVQISLSTSNIKIQKGELRIIALNSISSELEAKEIESWVKLIRVMTHEIMNSIAPIMSLTDMLLYSYKSLGEQDDTMLRENTVDSLTTINSTAKGLTAFVHSYREFSKVANPNLISLELLPFIDSILKLEQAEMDSQNIKVSISLEKENFAVQADEAQLSRVVVNLLKNAIEALENTTDKEIRIDARSNESGDKLRINIANNGDPIPPEILENIFIPFFTTKNTGSGIGLSVSRYIMRLHGGNLKHLYENGWTIFSLTLLNEEESR